MNLTPQLSIHSTSHRSLNFGILFTALLALFGPAPMMAQPNRPAQELELGETTTHDLTGGQSETHLIRIVSAPQIGPRSGQSKGNRRRDVSIWAGRQQTIL